MSQELKRCHIAQAQMLSFGVVVVFPLIYEPACVVVMLP